MTETPRVSIGIPVYNGSDYLEEAVDSILGQTMGDFELLIQDNASTDATEDICRAYEKRDKRVSYVRNPENVGAPINYNLVFERARAPYFKWAAHDDTIAPVFLERCVEALDNNPDSVVAAGRTVLINDDGSPVRYDEQAKVYVTRHGNPVGIQDPNDRARGDNTAGRFWDILVRTMRTFEIFGLMRTSALKQTVLHENYYGSDKPLLAQMALLGKFEFINEDLMYRRCHAGQSSLLSTQQKSKWISRPSRDNWLSHRIRFVVPAYFKIVGQTPSRFDQKMLCHSAILWRLVAPQTWVKQFMPGRLTET